MEKRKHVFWELLLLIASVFVFRGLWLILDRTLWFNTIESLWVSVIFGVIIFGIALYKIVHADKFKSKYH